jgi:pyruvate/2-oxoglutarate dehydrogenase complex dihydrolipoamide dehydrogenase (E3) component
VLPDDVHNRKLVAEVHPPDWQNPTPRGRYNLVVLGAGTAGLVSAAITSVVGGRVALVERHLMGGDCLNTGCVPSKALIRASRAAVDVREAEAFGVRAADVEANFPAAMERLRRVRAEIAPDDAARRYAGLGADVFFGDARFVARDAVEVDGRELRFARAVVATGGRPSVPPIPGLEAAGFFTNETIFSLTDLPRRLVVIGGGPVGCELAQAFRRFGSEVTLLSRGPRLLPHDDADAVAILERRFAVEGVALRLEAKILRIDRRAAACAVVFEHEGRTDEVLADELLVATGRTPNVEGLDLEKAGVVYDGSGVKVDDRLRTSNRRIYAAGDISSRYKFTHTADAFARIAIQNALFFGRKRASALVIPWTTYTDPEIAQVGINQRAAQARRDVATLNISLNEVHRAVVDGETEGFARVHAQRRTGKVLGATLVARHAGEMISELSLAVSAGLTLGDISRTIHPYPTQAEAWKRLGDAWPQRRLTPFLHRLLERFLALRR